MAKLDSVFFSVIRRIRISENLILELPPDPHFIRYLLQTHEPHVARAISRLSSENGSVVDVGANIGYFSALALKAVGRKGRVYCFEPERRNYQRLMRNCKLWRKCGYFCRTYPVAISSTHGSAVLKIHRLSTYHSIESGFHKLDRIESFQEVGLMTLDEWASSENVETIEFLKIDTEGHEPQVLEGARGLFQENRVKYAILECRDEDVAIYIDKFCQEYSLHQLNWDGQAWFQGTSQSIAYRTECLVSRNPVLPATLDP